jgi:hypothetical protein
VTYAQLERMMGYVSARDKFENVQKMSNDTALRNLAEGLIELSRSLEDDLRKIKSEIDDLDRKIR